MGAARGLVDGLVRQLEPLLRDLGAMALEKLSVHRRRQLGGRQILQELVAFAQRKEFLVSLVEKVVEHETQFRNRELGAQDADV